MLPRIFRLLFGFTVLHGAASQDPAAVVGVRVDPRAGGVPLRKSINELESIGGPQWDLYIRAMAAMHEDDHSDPMSYFQLMGWSLPNANDSFGSLTGRGIHGKPYIEWNSGGGKQTDEWQGYCPHGEKLFLPWHRPFVLIYEQVLVEHAKRIALEYPQRYRYQYTRAAEELRSPFWDWGLETEVPAATVPEKLTVNVPDDDRLDQVEVDNPLRTFKFPRAALEGEYGHFDSENRTQIYRCPSPESYPESANQKVAARPYKRWIYDCFTHAKDFADFASTGDSGISLEQIHNGVHWDGACGGQLLASDFSAFDPLFMLHHTNVDRLWAYWQFMQPQHSRFNNPYSGGSRYSTPKGAQIGPDSPLNPFKKANGDFHTTRSVDNIRDFGYSYQGLEYWDKSPAEMRREATRLINRLYGPDNPELRRSARRGKNTTTTQYFANIEVDVTELDRPCILELYVGGQKAGDFVVMEQPRTGVIHGGFPLEVALAKAQMQQYSPENTIQSITSTIEVSIVKRDGERIALKSVPGLKVEIEDVTVAPPQAEDELPEFGTSRRRLVTASEKHEVAVFA